MPGSILRPLLLLLLSATLAGCGLSAAQQEMIGRPAPDGRYYLLDGAVESIPQSLGKVLVLAFWDAECRYCRAEMPRLNELARSFIGDERISFIAISINFQQEEPQLLKTIEELNLDALRLSFSGNGVHDEAFRVFGGDQVPFIVLIGKDGIVRWMGDSAKELRDPLIDGLAERGT